ncbi:hypothetical protein DOTSEDRAFT_34542 [Dothistroma septosporum NZE10]|uniref:Uncharacterized protein n=1 Tax=Dothistroma septosporum (strain NZE10 / CBS 128990) TaxID=675120 RepID=N1PKH7_DOTSN|nr:hypothetical protein DOTSEDRAFT_34542 [Dothistroma septosporum NZE10]
MVYTSYQMDGCSLTTLPAHTIEGIVSPTVDVRCTCGETMSGVIFQGRGDYAYVQCATGVETLLVAPDPTPPHGTQLLMHAGSSMTTSISPTTSQSVTCGNTTTSVPAITTRYITDGCSLTTIPAGTPDASVFPTADVKCACDDVGTAMPRMKTWSAGATTLTATTSAASNGSFSVAASAGTTGGGSSFDAQTGGTRGKMGLTAMLSASFAFV